MKIKLIILISCFVFLPINSSAQQNNEYSFQNFFNKGKSADKLITEISMDYYSSFESNAVLNLKVLYPLFQNIELGGRIGYSYFKYNQNGPTNFMLTGKYNFEIEDLFFAVGVQFYIETGSEKVYANYTDNNVFVAFNKRVSDKIILNISISRTFGSSISENATIRPEVFELNDIADKIGLEFLYEIDADWNIVLEVASNDYTINDNRKTLISLGTNYKTASLGTIRTAAGIDLNETETIFFTLGVLF